MKKTTIGIISIVLLFFTGIPTFAANNISYVGADLTNIQQTNCANTLGLSDPKFFTTSTAGSIWNQTFNTPENDCVSIAQSNSLSITTYIGEKGSNLDSLGYADFLLSLGIYSGDIKIVNANDLTSLAQALQAYSDGTNYSIPSTRIKDVKKEYDLYTQVLSETKNTLKTSQIFFTLEKDGMEDPQTHFATRSIVDIATKQAGAKLSSSTINALYSWEYNYIVDGNNWSGFYRNINESTTRDGVVKIYYSELYVAPSSTSSDMLGNKIGALVFFLSMVFIIGAIIYSRKKKLSNT